MNVNPILKRCLGFINLPVEPEPYTGDADEYISFVYADERPALSGDDTDILDTTTVQVHCYTRKNPQNYKKKIRLGLRLGGFVVLSTTEIHEKSSGYNHIVVTAEIEGEIDADELPDEEEEY